MNNPIKERAVEVFQVDGLECYIVPSPCWIGFNGYALFPKRPVREVGYAGIISYVPVHGGITFAHECDDGIIYGFDTGHCDSGEYPINDKDWIKGQITIMIQGIKLAATLEDKYLRCKTNKGRAKYADKLLDLQRDQSRSFGVCLNLLSGKL